MSEDNDRFNEALLFLDVVNSVATRLYTPWDARFALSQATKQFLNSALKGIPKISEEWKEDVLQRQNEIYDVLLPKSRLDDEEKDFYIRAVEAHQIKKNLQPEFISVIFPERPEVPAPLKEPSIPITEPEPKPTKPTVRPPRRIPVRPVGPMRLQQTAARAQSENYRGPFDVKFERSGVFPIIFISALAITQMAILYSHINNGMIETFRHAPLASNTSEVAANVTNSSMNIDYTGTRSVFTDEANIDIDNVLNQRGTGSFLDVVDSVAGRAFDWGSRSLSLFRMVDARQFTDSDVSPLDVGKWTNDPTIYSNMTVNDITNLLYYSGQLSGPKSKLSYEEIIEISKRFMELEPHLFGDLIADVMKDLHVKTETEFRGQPIEEVRRSFFYNVWKSHPLGLPVGSSPYIEYLPYAVKSMRDELSDLRGTDAYNRSVDYIVDSRPLVETLSVMSTEYVKNTTMQMEEYAPELSVVWRMEFPAQIVKPDSDGFIVWEFGKEQEWIEAGGKFFTFVHDLYPDESGNKYKIFEIRVSWAHDPSLDKLIHPKLWTTGGRFSIYDKNWVEIEDKILAFNLESKLAEYGKRGSRQIMAPERFAVLTRSFITSAQEEARPGDFFSKNMTRELIKPTPSWDTGWLLRSRTKYLSALWNTGKYHLLAKMASTSALDFLISVFCLLVMFEKISPEGRKTVGNYAQYMKGSSVRATEQLLQEDTKTIAIHIQREGYFFDELINFIKKGVINKTSYLTLTAISTALVVWTFPQEYAILQTPLLTNAVVTASMVLFRRKREVLYEELLAYKDQFSFRMNLALFGIFNPDAILFITQRLLFIPSFAAKIPGGNFQALIVGENVGFLQMLLMNMVHFTTPSAMFPFFIGTKKAAAITIASLVALAFATLQVRNRLLPILEKGASEQEKKEILLIKEHGEAVAKITPLVVPSQKELLNLWATPPSSAVLSDVVKATEKVLTSPEKTRPLEKETEESFKRISQKFKGIRMRKTARSPSTTSSTTTTTTTITDLPIFHT